jgi:lysophospholipase L1-like esterase
MVTTTLVLLLTSEIVLRVFFSHLFPSLDWIARFVTGLGYQYDQTLGWCPIPNSHLEVPGDRTISVSHNSHGFRDVEPVFDQRPRIVFLGDSMVWGSGVEASERFTDKLRAWHPDWAVFNFGVSGYGTDQEYLLLQRYFSQYQPQVVFLVYCALNDDGDNSSNGRSEYYYKPYFVLEQNALRLRGVPVPHSERVFHHNDPLLSKSYLLCLALRAGNNLLHPPLPRHTSPTLALVAALQQYVEARGGTLYIGLTGPDHYLEAFLRRAHISYVDLSTHLLISDGVHWNPEGQTYVAGKIEEFLAGKFPKRSGAADSRPPRVEGS